MKAHPAAHAPNWWRILLVDASIGIVVAAIGVAVALRWNVIVGVALVVLGTLYVLAVGRRFLQWRWLRRNTDPPPPDDPS